jgi:hypothetical protein
VYVAAYGLLTKIFDVDSKIELYTVEDWGVKVGVMVAGAVGMFSGGVSAALSAIDDARQGTRSVTSFFLSAAIGFFLGAGVVIWITSAATDIAWRETMLVVLVSGLAAQLVATIAVVVDSQGR